MTIDTQSLQYFLKPRSVAIVGASQDQNKIGGRPLHYLQKFGFKGKIFAINPGRPEVQGVPAFASIDKLPEVPELAVIAVPGDSAVAAIKECAAQGVKAAICITSGFGETSDPVGMAKQIWVMVAAVVCAVGVMLAFAGSVSAFVERHPTVKMLALSFLILIGVMLLAEGVGTHVEKGYIYFAMAFSLGVEFLNIVARGKGARSAASPTSQSE